MIEPQFVKVCGNGIVGEISGPLHTHLPYQAVEPYLIGILVDEPHPPDEVKIGVSFSYIIIYEIVFKTIGDLPFGYAGIIGKRLHILSRKWTHS